MIEAHQLTRSYGSVRAVDHVSFTARPGEVVGLLGPNGAGKTTVMKILTGYHLPHGGRASVAGYDVVATPLEVRRRCGYLPENPPLYDELTVGEYLAFVARARACTNPSAVADVAGRVGLGDSLDRLIGELSKGYRQRVGLAQALIHDPEVLVLDEPTSGLDPNQIQEARALVRELGARRTVLLSTHVLREVEAMCDRVVIIDRGRVAAAGTTAEIAARFEHAALVEIEVDRRVVGAAADGLAAIATIVERGGGASSRLVVALSAGHETVELFDWAVTHGLRLHRLIPREYSLEELFARLTGERA